MSQTFALTCSCGSTVPVSVKQAGSTVVCPACSNVIDVPKLRDIRQLEPIESPTERRTRGNWSGLQGLLFVLGFLCMAIAAGSSYYTFAHRLHYDEVEKPQPEQIEFEHDINLITLVDSWETWKQFKDANLAGRPTPYYVYAQEQVERMDGWLKIFGIVATVGLILMLFSFLAGFARVAK